jgi:U4/U6.U5 tri-snRNP-associated protein 1
MNSMENKEESAAEWLQRKRNQKAQQKRPAQPSGPNVPEDDDHFENMTVKHSIADIKQGGQTILVFEDSHVLEDGNEVLVNPELVQKEKDLKNRKVLDKLRQKQRGKGVSHLDDVEIEEQTKKEGFQLKKNLVDESARIDYDDDEADNFAAIISIGGEKGKKKAEDDFEDVEKAFKKRKKKKFKVKTKEESSVLVAQPVLPVDFENDEEDQFHAVLLRNRKTEQKKRKEVDLDAALKQAEEAESSILPTGGQTDVLTETSEFLQRIRAKAQQNTKAYQIPQESQTEELPVEMDIETEEITETAPLETIKDTPDVVPEVEKGVGFFLSQLKDKGVFKKKTEEELEQERLTKEHLEFKQSVQKISQSNISERERIRLLEEKFKDYKPQINLDKKDEYGRVLSKKEAWKKLCYKFHGMEPGKNAKEKMLRKVAEDLAKERQPILQGEIREEVLGEVKKSTKQSYLVVSKGKS